MAINGNGSTGYVKSSAAITGPTRFTFSFHHYDTVAPDIATYAQPFALANSGATYDASFSWRHVSGAASFFMKQAAGTYQQTSAPVGVLDANAWYVITCVYDGTNMLLYVNGQLVNNVAASAPPMSLSIVPSAFAGLAGTSAFDDGTNCECAAWDVALPLAKIQMLGHFFAPPLVQLENMLLYWPLIRNVTAPVGTITSGGTLAVVDHSPVIMGRSQKSMRFTNQKTYSFSPSGGFTLGGSATIAAAYVHAPSGGFTLGGSSIIATNASFTTGKVYTAGGNLRTVTTRITRGSTFGLPQQFSGFTTGRRRKNKFLADSSELANGRITDRLD